MVKCHHGFANCMKRTDSAGTCTPCNSAAWIAAVLSEVEEVVAVCEQIWRWRKGFLLSLECIWATSPEIVVHYLASICMCKSIIRSILMSAGAPTKAEITTKEARAMAGPHSSLRYLVCPSISKCLPLAPCIIW